MVYANDIHIFCVKRICDMIKGNESDVTDIVFEILAKKEFIPMFSVLIK